jgi:adenylate cyclase
LRNKDRSTLFALVALSVAAVAATHAMAATGALDGANDRVFDRLMQWRNRSGFAPPLDRLVVHIDLDDAAVLRSRTVTRAHIADVMRTLAASGVSAQAYDITFAGEESSNKAPSNRAPADRAPADRAPADEAPADEALAAAARSAGNVFTAAVIQSAAARSLDAPTGSAAWVPWRIHVEGDASAIPLADAWTVSFDALQRSVRGTGAVNINADADGLYRRIPLMFRAGDGFLPALALAVSCGYLGVQPDAIVLAPGHSLTLRGARRPGAAAADIVIPIDASGAMRLNFPGPWASHDHYAFHDLWRDGMDPTAGPMWRAALHDRIALVGDVSTGRGDLGAVPVDSTYPLPGLHATAIRNIVGGSFLASGPRWTMWAATVLAAGLVLLVASRWPQWLWPAAILVAAAIGAAGIGLFLREGVIVNVVEPIVAVGVQTSLAAAWRYFDESRERALTRRAFESYFPPAVVARLLSDGRAVAGSRRKEVTVLFSDIVGFTSRSAPMSPEGVQRFLNEYFSRMVAVVFRHRGTVDKFIGDGLMVFFNDPEDQPDHAARAVRCALDLQAETRALSRTLIDAGQTALQIRIGINTGVALVGDLGSADRLSYTAVGAAVNLAQRLESVAPPDAILISADTAARLPENFRPVSVEDVQLKGFDVAVRVFRADRAPTEAFV